MAQLSPSPAWPGLDCSAASGPPPTPETFFRSALQNPPSVGKAEGGGEREQGPDSEEERWREKKKPRERGPEKLRTEAMENSECIFKLGCQATSEQQPRQEEGKRKVKNDKAEERDAM